MQCPHKVSNFLGALHDRSSFYLTQNYMPDSIVSENELACA
jgi:hypothetical protein